MNCIPNRGFIVFGPLWLHLCASSVRLSSSQLPVEPPPREDSLKMRPFVLSSPSTPTQKCASTSQRSRAFKAQNLPTSAVLSTLAATLAAFCTNGQKLNGQVQQLALFAFEFAFSLSFFLSLSFSLSLSLSGCEGIADWQRLTRARLALLAVGHTRCALTDVFVNTEQERERDKFTRQAVLASSLWLPHQRSTAFVRARWSARRARLWTTLSFPLLALGKTDTESHCAKYFGELRQVWNGVTLWFCKRW